MISERDILKLRKQLLPTGRAFNVPAGGNFEKLLLALAGQEAEAFNAALSLLDSIIPDNENFSAEDAAMWEETLSVSSSESDSLVNRKAAIYRKMQFPGGAKGRQHKNYLEGQLKAANFNVKIYEYGDIKNYFSNTVHASDTVHSYEIKHGGWNVPTYTGTIANYLNEDLENDIPVTLDNLRNIFWIAGDTFAEFVAIPPYRVEEFRHIVLTIKPLHMVAFLRIINADNWVLASGKWNMSGYWYNTGIWTS
jgi:uncharacterized protein YmfQ (DUF2313 family)